MAVHNNSSTYKDDTRFFEHWKIGTTFTNESANMTGLPKWPPGMTMQSTWFSYRTKALLVAFILLVFTLLIPLIFALLVDKKKSYKKGANYSKTGHTLEDARDHVFDPDGKYRLNWTEGVTVIVGRVQAQKMVQSAEVVQPEPEYEKREIGTQTDPIYIYAEASTEAISEDDTEMYKKKTTKTKTYSQKHYAHVPHLKKQIKEMNLGGIKDHTPGSKDHGTPLGSKDPIVHHVKEVATPRGSKDIGSKDHGTPQGSKDPVVHHVKDMLTPRGGKDHGSKDHTTTHGSRDVVMPHHVKDMITPKLSKDPSGTPRGSKENIHVSHEKYRSKDSVDTHGNTVVTETDSKDLHRHKEKKSVAKSTAKSTGKSKSFMKTTEKEEEK